MPEDVYHSLAALAAPGNASKLLQMLQRDSHPDHRLVHPGDSFGRIVAWMWGRDRDQAVLFLADHLAELRQHQHLAAEIDPPISLEELLWGLRMAWPPDAEHDYDTVAAYVRDHVTGYYSDAG